MPTKQSSSHAPGPTGQVRVVIVEDDRDAADTLRQLLELLVVGQRRFAG
jgi:hypothetical protein